MKYKFFLFLAGMLSMNFSTAFANHLAQNIMVVAIPDQMSATTMGQNVYYTKSFRLNVLNANEEDIDLSEGCFVGYDKSSQNYYVDIIDERIANAKLAAGKNIKGNIAFSSDNSQVYNIQFVRFESKCD